MAAGELRSHLLLLRAARRRERLPFSPSSTRLADYFPPQVLSDTFGQPLNQRTNEFILGYVKV